MKITLSELKRKSKSNFLLEYSEYIDMGEDRDFSLSSPVFVKFKVFFNRRNYDVIIVGKINYSLSMTCSRCLERFNKDFSLWVRGIFKFHRDRYKDKEIELTKRDLDTFYYENGKIDLDRFVIESIIVNVPMKPLCREDCKGLCPVCGANLNFESCNCKIDNSKKESPFKVLSFYSGGGRVDNTKKENIQGKKR